MLSKKQEISNCAASLFRKKGYKATSMRDIAQQVGMKAASLYNHISSKEELFSDLLLEMATLFTNGMSDIYNSSLNASEKLEKLISLHVRLTIEHTDAISLIVGEWVHLPESNLKKYIAHRNGYEKKFREIIDQGKKENLYKDIDSDLILFSILSTLRSLYSWYSKNTKYNTIELEKQIVESLLNGIRK